MRSMSRRKAGSHKRLPARPFAATAAIVGLTIAGLRWSVVEVAGHSMLPSLRPGDRLLTVPAVRCLLRCGALVIVEDPGQDGHLVIKRLVRLAGDQVTVVGDSARHSTDSRHWGPIARARVRRVVVCRWPQVGSVLIGPGVDRIIADHAWDAVKRRR